MTESSAIYMIKKELAKARGKFPWWPTDPIHAAAIIGEESGELTRAALQFMYENGPYRAMLDEAIQVGAMAVRFIENIHEYNQRGYNGKQVFVDPDRPDPPPLPAGITGRKVCEDINFGWWRQRFM